MSEQYAAAETGNPAPSDSERQLGLLVHLLAFAGWVFPIGNIIAPLVLWAVKKDESEFLDWHGRQSVNFQISITIYALVGLMLVWIFIGIPLLFALAIFDLVVVILAAVKAVDGLRWSYPLAIPILT